MAVAVVAAADVVVVPAFATKVVEFEFAAVEMAAAVAVLLLLDVESNIQNHMDFQIPRICRQPQDVTSISTFCLKIMSTKF